MKKLTSLLLVLVMLVSLFSVTALAAESNDYVEAEASIDAAATTVYVTITAKQDTTNGKLAIKYDSACLSYTDSESEAAAFSADDENGIVSLGYADTTANKINSGEVIVTLEFAVTGAWNSTGIEVTVVNFNAESGLDADVPVVSISKPAGGGVAPGPVIDPETGPEPEVPKVDFDDVASDAWYSEAVKYVVGKGYFKGITEEYFGPEYSMTRAMFVTVLGRMAGVEADSYTNSKFVDVAEGEYYAGYVAWAESNGIVLGTSDTTFSPNVNVTREQMAAFLYRYAKYAGMDVSNGDDASIDSFSDAGSVSEWAKPAVEWAVTNGIINGTGAGLEPQATATRAQVAQIVYNFDALAD